MAEDQEKQGNPDAAQPDAAQADTEAQAPEAKPEAQPEATAEAPREGESNAKGEGKSKGDSKAKGEGKSKGESKAKGESKGKGKADSKTKGRPRAAPPEPPRLKVKFEQTVRPELGRKFDISNPMAQPRVDKVVISVGLGNQLEGGKIRPAAKKQVLDTLTQISGQKPAMKRARKSVSNFKVREGMETGAMVTLRGPRMWEFLDKLISTAIPRIKDFRGLNRRSFDGRGNYSFGLTEQAVFPEVDVANAEFLHGMHLTIVIRNSTDEISLELLQQLGVPFTRLEDTTRRGQAA